LRHSGVTVALRPYPPHGGCPGLAPRISQCHPPPGPPRPPAGRRRHDPQGRPRGVTGGGPNPDGGRRGDGGRDTGRGSLVTTHTQLALIQMGPGPASVSSPSAPPRPPFPPRPVPHPPRPAPSDGNAWVGAGDDRAPARSAKGRTFCVGDRWKEVKSSQAFAERAGARSWERLGATRSDSDPDPGPSRPSALTNSSRHYPLPRPPAPNHHHAR
jgi:hypothetical protein